MHTLRCSVLIALFFPLFCWGRDIHPPQVVVTIAPLHSLVAGVMDGIATPTLLMPGNISPHHYTLKPSTARLIDTADAVFWVGEAIESGLVRALKNMTNPAHQLEMMTLPSLQRLPFRSGDAWEHKHDDHGEAGEHGHHHDTHEEVWDPHIWLDPHNARVIVLAVKDRLIELDPEHTADYTRNAQRLEQRLQALDRDLEAALVPLRDTPYLVFHDAYHYFEDRYGLNAVGAISPTPEQRPGARHLRAVEKKIKQRGVRCIFSEPQFTERYIDLFDTQDGIRYGELDPLGSGIKPGPEHYFLMMRTLAGSLQDCLGTEGASGPS